MVFVDGPCYVVALSLIDLLKIDHLGPLFIFLQNQYFGALS